jgi:radical SAM protein
MNETDRSTPVGVPPGRPAVGDERRTSSRSAAPALRAPRSDTAERPFLVIWEATQACPLACYHCRAEARPNRDPRELTTAEATRLMQQVADFGRPAPLFVITGGDPFQRPDLYELVAAGAEIGLPVSVSPSGTPTLTRSALSRLHDAGARAVSLSVDAGSAGNHDGFRGVEGVFQWTLDAWQHALDLGLKVQVNTTVSRRTVADLPLVADLVRARRAMLWSIFLLVPTGRGRSLAALDAAEVEDVLHALYDLGETIPVKTTEAHHFRRVWLQRQVLAARGLDPAGTLGLGPLYGRLREGMQRLDLLRSDRVRRPPMQVSAARGFVFVSHIGAVHPSGFLPVGAGNVREQDLGEIYRTAPLFVGLRDLDRLGGRCGRCEFRAVCGGSRARAYGATGDAFAEDPAWGYEPGSFPFADDVAVLLAEAERGVPAAVAERT